MQNGIYQRITNNEREEILKILKITEEEPFQKPLSPYKISDKATDWKFLDYGGVSLSEIDGVIQRIGIAPIENLRADQIIVLYGPPSHVLLFKGFGDYSFVGKILIYESTGIYISLGIVPYDHSMKPTIEEGDMVERISFTNPTLFCDYLNNLYNTDLNQGEQEIDVFGQLWHGFGEYEYSR
jgi:hypothetical protein